jgi:hypothetical protein
VTRWSGTGTHLGELMGIPPTGKRGTVTGISIGRYEGGKLVEEWLNFDALGCCNNSALSQHKNRQGNHFGSPFHKLVRE